MRGLSRSEDAGHETTGTDYGKPYLPEEYSVLLRPLTLGGYELVLSLDRPLALETLKRLGSETDLAHLIELALSLAAPKLEITPAMIEAGEAALIPFYVADGVYDLRTPGLTAVFAAMILARKESR